MGVLDPRALILSQGAGAGAPAPTPPIPSHTTTHPWGTAPIGQASGLGTEPPRGTNPAQQCPEKKTKTTDTNRKGRAQRRGHTQKILTF